MQARRDRRARYPNNSANSSAHWSVRVRTATIVPVRGNKPGDFAPVVDLVHPEANDPR